MNITTDLTTEQRQQIRKEKNFSKKYLFIYNPPTVFSCQLSAVPETNNKVVEVEYDNGIGDYEDVEVGMTCYIGTSAGAYDLGMVRIRQLATEDTLYIGETSEIKWDYDGTVYLTVVDERAIWAKHPRLYTDGTYNMDYDIEYDDQHENFKPVVNVSCNPCDWLINGNCYISFNASGSWSFLEGSATYLWECETGVISDDEISNPVIQFDTVGMHKVYVTVTIGGVSKTKVIYAFVFGEGFMPIENFVINSLSGDFESGGWELDVTVFEEDAVVRNGAMAILFSKDIYNSIEEYYIGAELHRENICMQGWISFQEELDFNPIEGNSNFVIKSPNAIMESTQAFTDGLESCQDTPADWTEIQDLNVDKAVWHLLEWRSTCLDIFDWYPTNDDRFIKQAQVGETKLWQQVTLNCEAILAKACFNKYGVLYTEVEQQLVDPDEREEFPVIVIESDDWQEKVNVTRFIESQYSRIMLSGVYFEEGIEPKPLFSLSPGHVFKRFGDTYPVEEIALWQEQTKSNLLAGLYLAWLNHEYEVEITLAEEVRMIDLVPRQRIYIEVPAGYSSRGIPFEGNVIPRTIDYQENQETGSSYYVINGENETFPENNIDGDIPETEDFDTSFPSFPPFPSLPRLPVPIFVPPLLTILDHPKNAVGATDDFGIIYTKTFDKVSPEINEWFFMNSGLSDAEKLDIFNLVVTPIGAIYIQLETAEKVMRASGLGATFYEVANASDFIDSDGIHSIGVHPNKPDTIIIVGLGQAFGDAGKVRFAESGVLGATQGDVNLRAFKGCTVFSNGKWLVFGSYYGLFTTPWVCRYSESGTLEYDDTINTAVGQDAAVRYAVCPGFGDKVYQWDASASSIDYNIITNGGETVNGITTSENVKPVAGFQGMAFAPDGLNGIMCDRTTPFNSYVTSDGGSTWASLSATIPAGSFVWENCNSINRFMFGGDDEIRLTIDNGLVYFDKKGNIPLIAPLMNLTHLRYIP